MGRNQGGAENIFLSQEWELHCWEIQVQSVKSKDSPLEINSHMYWTQLSQNQLACKFKSLKKQNISIPKHEH